MQEVPEEDDCMLLGDEQSEFFLCIHVVGFHLARKSYRNNHPIFMIYSLIIAKNYTHLITIHSCEVPQVLLPSNLVPTVLHFNC